VVCDRGVCECRCADRLQAAHSQRRAFLADGGRDTERHLRFSISVAVAELALSELWFAESGFAESHLAESHLAVSESGFAESLPGSQHHQSVSEPEPYLSQSFAERLSVRHERRQGQLRSI